MSIIYLDNAATTQLSPSVLEEMMPYLTDQYGNPSSNYSLGIKSRKAKEAAREKVASLINARPDEIYFTSGATESNNWVLSSVTKEFDMTGCLMVSNIEHSSVIKTAERLTRDKYAVVSCSGTGEVFSQGLERRFNAMSKHVTLVSIMAANNETGTVNDVGALCTVAHERSCLFHTDATQLLGHAKIDVKYWGVDALSGTAHKIYGPKGVGFLYINRESPLYEIMQRSILISGGHQESGMRAGTENVAGIVGLGAACDETKKFLSNKKGEMALRKMRKEMEHVLRRELGVIINSGDVDRNLPVLNMTIPGAKNIELVQVLDDEGVCVSAGSACNENSHEPSHVLSAMGLKANEIDSTIRVSIGRYNTETEIRVASEIIIDKVKTLRMFSS